VAAARRFIVFNDGAEGRALAVEVLDDILQPELGGRLLGLVLGRSESRATSARKPLAARTDCHHHDG